MDLTSPNTKSPPPQQPEPTESTETAAAAAAAPAPPRIQTTKHLSFTNGVLKRHQNNHNHQHHPHPIVITYKECLKNHAASLGGHALDGCGEFMPSPTATATDPTSLKCAACGCHRNFHRREPDDINSPTPNTTTTIITAANNNTATIEYQPHHRHHPPPPPTQPVPNPPPSNRSPNSSSPPPISSSYYPSAPHMLLALSGSLQDPSVGFGSGFGSGSGSRKRFRTKFSQTQKERMYEFAEKVGWKMQKRDDEMVSEFCNEVGVDRTVLKVWMHNNKNTFGKQLQNQNQQYHPPSNTNTNGSIVRSINLENSEDKKKEDEEDEEDDNNNHNNNKHSGGLNRHFESVAAVNGGGGGSSSSS